MSLTPCQHRDKWRGSKGDLHIHDCAKLGVKCIEALVDLPQMVGTDAAACEGCPHYNPMVTDTEKVFADIFGKKDWGDGESISGPGSSLESTAKIREELHAFLGTHAVTSLLDLPCGDHHWLSQVDLSGIEYTGGDVVRDLVERNAAKWPEKDWQHLDLVTSDFPQADAVLVRDCLVHLPYREAGAALQNIVRSGAKWLITTHFPGRTNHEIPMGSWRPLDLTAKPFNLPEPYAVINEGCTEGGGAYADKSLGIWLIKDIEDAVAKLNQGPLLTIGMATYRDWEGVWATVENIFCNHKEVLDDIEFVIIDNDPNGKPAENSESDHSSKCRRLMESVGGKYEHFTAVQGTAAAKGRVFELASAPTVLVIDCHVIMPAGSLKRLIEYARDNPDSKDLWQGPCIALNNSMGDYFEPKWGSLMFGKWAQDIRAKGDEPFEIPMQGCGLMACQKAAWPGFHPLLRGFGPEEWHIHQRVRRNGGKCLCLPWLKWCHRFGHPGGPENPGMSVEERLRGHLITHYDTGGDESLEPMRVHFVDDMRKMTRRRFDEIDMAVQKEMRNPEPVGTILKALLAEMDIKPAPGCGCNAWIADMDVWGVDGCSTDHRAAIIDHLTKAALQSGWLNAAKAAVHGYFTVASLLDEALRRAGTENAVSEK